MRKIDYAMVFSVDRIAYGISTLILLSSGVLAGKMVYDIELSSVGLSSNYSYVGAVIVALSLYFVYSFFKVEDPPAIEAYEPVTIVVPAYNEEDVLEGCIEHLLKIDYPEGLFEILIVYEPDCSDRTGEIALDLASKYENVYAIKNHDKYQGTKAGALNLARKYARGTIIGVYDADHHVEKDVVKRAVAWLGSDDKIGAVDGSCSVRNRGYDLGTRFIGGEIATGIDLIRFIEDRVVDSHFIYGSNFFIRAKVLDAVGGFDDRVVGEDKEMGMRLIDHGYRIKLDLGMRSWEQVTTGFRSWWNQRKRWDRGRFQILSKYLPNILDREIKISNIKRAYPFLFVQVLSYPLGLVGVGFIVFTLYVAFTNPLLFIYFFMPFVLLFLGRSIQDMRSGMADWKDLLISVIMPFYIYSRAFIGFKAMWEEIFDIEPRWIKVRRTKDDVL
ncbi:MAG: glycosyltransferase family 2 protein [Candidatus Syntropharchaeales archaeon]